MPKATSGKGKPQPNTVELDVKSKAEGEQFAAFDKEGIYNCASCSHPLYNATDKLVGTNKKPSFNKPRSGAITYVEDYSYGLPRIAASCSKCGQAVGHVYNRKTQKERHILYSASIAFVLGTNTEEKEDSGYDSESEESDVDDKEEDEELENDDEEEGEVDNKEDEDDEDEDEDEEEEEKEATQTANIFGRVAIVAGAAILLVGLKTVLSK